MEEQQVIATPIQQTGAVSIPPVQPPIQNAPIAPPPVVSIPAQPQQVQEEAPVGLWIAIIVIGFLVIVAIIASVMAKRKRLAQTREGINDNIETGQGGVGNTGIGNAVGNTKPDESYPYAFDDAQKICNAGGWIGSGSQYLWTFFGGTNVDKIKAVFENKTKAQVAAIMEAFSRTTCNQTLDAFMQKYCDEGERKQIYQLIKSAK